MKTCRYFESDRDQAGFLAYLRQMPGEGPRAVENSTDLLRGITTFGPGLIRLLSGF
jgi:hypothetical protein